MNSITRALRNRYAIPTGTVVTRDDDGRFWLNPTGHVLNDDAITNDIIRVMAGLTTLILALIVAPLINRISIPMLQSLIMAFNDLNIIVMMGIHDLGEWLSTVTPSSIIDSMGDDVHAFGRLLMGL
jgi:hypothetical protein